MTTERIPELEDHELADGLAFVSAHSLFDVLTLTDWERAFVAELPKEYARYGSITWRQRRSAREVLDKITRELLRRAHYGDVKTQANRS